jgi:putative ABC transport system permease protein
VLGGVRSAAFGLALGMPLAIAAATRLAPLLPGIGGFDPLTALGVPVAISLLAALASWLPARAAATIDPAGTLRE